MPSPALLALAGLAPALEAVLVGGVIAIVLVALAATIVEGLARSAARSAARRARLARGAR